MAGRAAVCMSAAATPGAIGSSPSDIWELSDADFPATQVSSSQVLALICQGKVGFGSRIRRPPETEWGHTRSRTEFGFAFPYVNLPKGKSKKKGAEVVGYVALNPSLPRALGLAMALASDPAARDLGFWWSAFIDWIPAPLVRRARLFEIWDGFWIAPLVESTVVMPGGWLNIYLLAFNLTDREQVRTLRPAKSEVAEGMKGNLSFSLPPWRWTIQLVSVPANRGPGGHTLTLNSRSGGERAATAAVVGVLTLGNFIYAPGSSGVSLQYQILPPESAQSVEAWQGYAMQAAAKRFEDAHATTVSDPAGGRVPKDVVLQRYRSYLTPSLIYAVLQNQERPPEQVFPGLLDEFLFDWFGHEGAEKALVSD